MVLRPWRCLCLIICLSLFAHVARADKDADARRAFEQGVAASSESRWQDARSAFQQSLSLVVKPSTLFNLAVADLKLGLSQEALDALDHFEQLADPKQHASMLARAATLRAEAERNRDAARPANERARGLIEPGNLSKEALASYVQGRDAYARGDDKQALDAFERAHRESGRNELLFDIGIAADRLRFDERAVDALSRFVDLFPALPEADQARRHLDRLNRVMAEKNQPEPATTLAVPREDGPGASASASAIPSAEPAPDLVAPRALLITGGVLAAGALGTAGWWIERSGAKEDRCLDEPSKCTNPDEVRMQKRAAMGVTLSLTVSSLALLTAGGVLLHKRKQGRVALQDLSLRAPGHGLAIGTRFSF
jgi:tetratricopeptide (TPR) repeat protein